MLLEHPVGSEDHHILGECLGNDQAIEGVAVMERKIVDRRHSKCGPE
jgi:hypothetical protein